VRRGRRRIAAGAFVAVARTPVTVFPVRACDPAVERAREAGGPVDEASYACQCGYWFRASVSTSVTCPHCGCGQAG
jgi:hypothetical protein